MKDENKNRDFVQFSRDNLISVAEIGRNGTQTALDIFLFICKHMDGYNALMCSYQVLQDHTSKSRVTCSKAVGWLKENGYIDVFKSGTSNVYTINPEIAWTSYGNQRKYCQFNGKVLISATENQEYFAKEKTPRKLKAPEKKSVRNIVNGEQRQIDRKQAMQRLEEQAAKVREEVEQIPGQMTLEQVV